MGFAEKCWVSKVIPFNPQGCMAAREILPLSYLLNDFGKPSYTEAIFALKNSLKIYFYFVHG